ncbi:ABC transporter ATP-binding protein [Tamaricihabitans halophyticus]|nr:ATP-binding cassette domain-containing protein [Tamaricihabitans halophyticus]
MAAKEVLRADAVHVDYRTPAGPATAVADVSFGVPDSGVTVLAGRSGSGKSTMLRVLGLLEWPSTGTVWYGDTDTGSLREPQRRELRRADLAVVFQNPSDNLLEYLSVGDNLRAAAQSAGRDCASVELLEQLGLPGSQDWRVTALSGGQQQRLAFGCALARGSSVILADEPTSQLDNASADLVLDTLRQLADGAIPVLVASHDPRLIELGDHLARLEDGRLVDFTSAGAS